MIAARNNPGVLLWGAPFASKQLSSEVETPRIQLATEQAANGPFSAPTVSLPELTAVKHPSG
jgi:hypothetical protein